MNYILFFWGLQKCRFLMKIQKYLLPFWIPKPLVKGYAHQQNGSAFKYLASIRTIITKFTIPRSIKNHSLWPRTAIIKLHVLMIRLEAKNLTSFSLQFSKTTIAEKIRIFSVSALRNTDLQHKEPILTTIYKIVSAVDRNRSELYSHKSL